jgi:hypothetical protein
MTEDTSFKVGQRILAVDPSKDSDFSPSKAPEGGF